QKATATNTPLGERKLLRRWEASQYLLAVWGLKRAPGSLSQDAVRGIGPEFHVFNNVPYYTPVGLDAWVKAGMSKPTRRNSQPRVPRPRSKRRAASTEAPADVSVA